MSKKSVFTAVVAATISAAFANDVVTDDIAAARYLDLSKRAYAAGDEENGDRFERLALMKAEAKGDPDYDWTEFNELRAELTDRNGKPFDFKASEFFKAVGDSNELRVCYVVDYSLSMKGQKEKLLRNELTVSLNKLPKDSKHSVFFFAGPVWQMGDEVKSVKNRLNYTVNHKGSIINWTGQGAHKWKSSEPTMPAPWRPSHGSHKGSLLSQVQTQKLVFGTDWSHPLKAALELDPMPHVIYFMTDGSCSTANQSSIAAAALAKEKGVRINAIAMMEPKAEKPMRYLAAQTGGDFVVVNKEGKCIVEKAGTVVCPHLEHEDVRDRGAQDRKRNKKAKNKRNKNQQ